MLGPLLAADQGESRIRQRRSHGTVKKDDAVLLAVENLTSDSAGGRLSGVSLTVRASEVVGSPASKATARASSPCSPPR